MDKANWPLFLENFDKLKPKIETGENTNEELESLTEQLVTSITKSLDCSVPKMNSNKQSQPWYNENLRRIKNQIDQTRKRIKRSKRRKKESEIEERLGELNELNKQYKKEIGKAKDEFYKKLNQVNGMTGLWKLLKKAKNIRGDSLKTFRKPDGKSTTDPNEIDEVLFDYFVPMDKNCSDRMSTRTILKTGELPPLEENELRQSIKYSLNKKAPGLDGIGNKPVKLLFDFFEPYFESYFNKLLRNVYMPTKLKCGRLIFFQKPGKKLDNVKGMRPITLLPVLGKVLEYLLIRRINDKLDDLKFFSPNQHGFTKQKSTSTAIKVVIDQMKKIKKDKTKYAIVVALDISSAFDRLNWNHLMKNLERTSMDGCYLEAVRQLLIDREIQYETGAGTLRRKSEIGCPQGGRASPGLWRIGMNDMLVNLTKNKILNVAFADDLALIIKANTLKRITKKFGDAINIIEQWCESAGLKLSVEKSQVLDIGKCECAGQLPKMSGHRIDSTKAIKYLGVMLDRGLKWNEHIKYIGEKANKSAAMMNKLNWMNKRMSLKLRRVLYTQVSLPALSYAHLLWYKELRYGYQKTRLTQIQRRVLLAITKAYRTTSNFKLHKLLGVLDINKEFELNVEHQELNGEERKAKYMEMLEDGGELHREIENTETRELLWYLSGHGPFRSYLKRFGIDESDECRLCEKGTAETPMHLLRECEATRAMMPEDENSLDQIEETIRAITLELYRKRREIERAKELENEIEEFWILPVDVRARD